MNLIRKSLEDAFRSLLVLVCTVVIAPGDTLASMPSAGATQAAAPQDQSAKIPPDQLDSLVAPIALYPDPMLAQTLAASTYPLELIQLQQWLAKHPEMKDKALADAVSKEPWDPSIQALAGLPEVVKRLADDIQWTTDLGNAFLAQQSDVMDAVQRMRKKAEDTGNLKSTEQQKVETRVIENKSIIVVEQANPQVVYVPSYDPVVVYGPPVYPYPPIYYPPAGYYAAGIAISFGVGMMMGAFWSGGWGWGCGWGGNNNININNNNNFNRNSNIGGGNRNNIGNGNRPSQQPGRGGGGRGDSSWKHNPQHRGGAPYGDRGTANKFGGTARGDSLSNRQARARQQVGRQGGNLPSNRGGAGVSNRASGAGAGNRSGGAGGGNRAGGGGADRVGSRDVSRGGGGNRDAFGGGSRGSSGYNGSSARSSSSRGSSSMGSRGGGGGGSRGGGGGRRR
ncbi:MAG TPA: DUF3300 domain-containing protein [Candidatus Limnocylindrales bacterium]|nr:DUF3300 domain-containing protein [Candidatus Limnocylindrales bacterium]